MAYFLKKSKLKKGLYLQIYESFYDPDRKQTAHKSYRAIGYLNELIDSGIEDPIAFFQAEVDKLNQEQQELRQKRLEQQISEVTPEHLLGYFPLKAINDSLGLEKYFALFQLQSGLQFSIFSLLSSLIYARVSCPCSKYRTFHDVLPLLFEPAGFSLDQLYAGLAYLGNDYEKVIEIYNHQIRQIYPFDTSHTYFDCTNFYFEIDHEDDFRKKGVSKENRNSPIVGLGLLLDAHQIPIGMKLYPGNQSEKPVIREVVDEMKTRSHATGKTIRIADKGLNCAENIVHALLEGDGYIFSKSVIQLSEIEEEWLLLANDYKEVKNKDGEILYYIKECVDDFPYRVFDQNGKQSKVLLKEKRVAVFNPKLARKRTKEIDRLVEKAKTMKSYQAKIEEYGESGKYVSFKVSGKNSDDDPDAKVTVTMNEKKIAKDLRLAGYSLFVTSETNLTASYIYSAYHNLWRIEESFRIMKSHLDARPVYLQREDTISGHFLVCYLSVLLTRLFQFKVLENEFCSEDIFDFFKNFRTVKISDRRYINISKSTPFIKSLAEKTGLPLTSYFLTESQIKKMLCHRF